MIWATVITDASFCPKTHAAAWAAWVRVDNVAATIKRHGEFRDTPQDSTHAEMLAALNGVWLAAQAGASGVLLQTDCMAVCSLANGKRPLWKDHLKTANLGHLVIKARHVKGHTTMTDARSWINRWCDRNARRVMRESRSRATG